MALIKCGECGREISDTAAACPSCGAPVTHAAVPAEPPASPPPPVPREESQPRVVVEDYRICATCGATYSRRYDSCPLCAVQAIAAKMDKAARWRGALLLLGLLALWFAGRNGVLLIIGAVLVIGNGFALLVGLVPFLKAASQRDKLRQAVKRGGRIG